MEQRERVSDLKERDFRLLLGAHIHICTAQGRLRRRRRREEQTNGRTNEPAKRNCTLRSLRCRRYIYSRPGPRASQPGRKTEDWSPDSFDLLPFELQASTQSVRGALYLCENRHVVNQIPPLKVRCGNGYICRLRTDCSICFLGWLLALEERVPSFRAAREEVRDGGIPFGGWTTTLTPSAPRPKQIFFNWDPNPS